MGSVRFRAQTMGRRPLPSAAHVRPGAHSARHQDSRNDLTPCRMAWHFVSASAHAPHSDQTLGPTRGAAHSARRLCSLASLCSSKEFTDRFCATGERQPTGTHAFDRGCTDNRIEHRPAHQTETPQTNGMIECFNGRIADVLATIRFDSAEHLTDTIKRYVQVYNQHIPQKALGLIPPLQAMRNWYQKQPNFFKKRVYNLAGLDR